MAREIPQRELRNDVSAVLAEVAAGNRVRVTVRGRPVADIIPVSERRRLVPREAVEELVHRNPLDPGFKRDVEAVLSENIDEL